jgi:hypothetical protein
MQPFSCHIRSLPLFSDVVGSGGLVIPLIGRFFPGVVGQLLLGYSGHATILPKAKQRELDLISDLVKVLASWWQVADGRSRFD